MKNILFILTVFITFVIPTTATAQTLRSVEPRPVEVEESKPASAQQLAKALTQPTPLAFHAHAKVFSCRYSEPKNLQRDLDAWLKDEGAKVEVTHVTQSHGGYKETVFVVLTVFYRVRN